jgi:hypothetical protein
MQLLIFYFICGALAYYIVWEFLLKVYLIHTRKDENPFYAYWFPILLGIIVLSVVLYKYNYRSYDPMTIELTSGEVVKDSFRINVYNNYETPNGEEYFRGAIKKTIIDRKK